ncbi:MAG: choice-of-anchor Q domain-containing protein, partial [Acidobacteriota bacterium]
FLPALTVCTLRAAVEETSEFAADDPASADIRLGAFTYPVSSAIGPLQVSGRLTLDIRGAGARETVVEGDGGDRVFDVDRFSDGADLTLRRLTVRGGGTDEVGGNIQARGQGFFHGFDIAIEAGAAGRGGGLGVHDLASATLTDSTVSGNSAFLDQSGGGDGAGIYAAGQNLELTNVTVSGNDGEGSGGGVAVFSGSYDFASITVTDNTVDDGDGGGVFFADEEAGEVGNSVIAGNTDDGDGAAPDCAGLVDSVGHNLVGVAGGSCGFVSVGDQTGSAASPVDAVLGPLADNGGDTDTHAPLGGSPVVDRGDPVDCPSSDQRGLARPFDGDGDGDARCDIGAVESGQVFIFSDGFESGDASRWLVVQP